MRKCPDWKSNTDPVNGYWKQLLLQYLGVTFGIKLLVETGTCQGAMCQFLSPTFKNIYTVELSDYYFHDSIRRLEGFSNVNCQHGDSRKWLPMILDKIPNEPTLFWLDAHSSGGATADAGDPLAEELQIIMVRRPSNALIVIDDMLDAELWHVQEAGVDFTGWTREYRTGEVIVYPEGRYEIPPFQEAE